MLFRSPSYDFILQKPSQSCFLPHKASSSVPHMKRKKSRSLPQPDPCCFRVPRRGGVTADVPRAGLSCEKLKLAHFTPLIAKIDRYMSGWRAILLSAGGRIVLINAVLDALPTYAMGAMELPPPLSAPLIGCAELSSGMSPIVPSVWWLGTLSVAPKVKVAWEPEIGRAHV